MSESQIQSAIMDFLRWSLPGTYRAFHVNNTPRNAIHGAQLKRMGMVAGVADICVVRGGEGAAVCFMEVKAPKGSLTKPQKEFRDWCGLNAVPFGIVRNVSDVENFLIDLNVPLKARATA
jgi:hypothetical protein